MDEEELLRALRSRDQTLYKLTGPPAHWLTTFHTGFWGLNPKYERTWKNLKAGQLALFHSTNPKYLSDAAIQSGVIGIGRVSGTSRKESLEWYDEITNDYNGWPYLLHFSDVWWFGDTGAVRDEPFREKLARGAGALVREARALTGGAISFAEMTVPGVGQLIPAMGSISRVGNPAAFVPLIKPRLDGAKLYGGIQHDSVTRLPSNPRELKYEVGGTRGGGTAETQGRFQFNPPAGVDGARETIGPDDIEGLSRADDLPNDDVTTGSRLVATSARLGQDRFSTAVRANYGHQCCFPGCDVVDNDYLVGAHIVRWSDDEEARGRVDNGLCLCLMHDQAFERGHFVLDSSYRVRSSTEQVGASKWAREHVLPWAGRRIRKGTVQPHLEYLAAHRARFER